MKDIALGMFVYVVCVLDGVSLSFFFRAEGGIRDVEGSLGLGELYKRQPPE